MGYLTDMYIEESNEKIIPNILRISHLNLLGVALKLRCKPPKKPTDIAPQGIQPPNLLYCISKNHQSPKHICVYN